MALIQPEFIPLSRREAEQLGWSEIDVLLVTGDAYVDHPSFGIAIVGRLLIDAGFRVGLIAQPDWKNPEALKEFGRPLVACGVTSGNLDSMLDLYTVGRRLRHQDVYSENGEPGKRPPHATVVYAQLVRQAFPQLPVILGGLEASLRRIVHYDYWQDKLRPGILVDSKADLVLYGMGEKTVPETYRRIADGKSLAGQRGSARLLGKKEAEAFAIDDSCIELPSWEEHLKNPDALMTSTVTLEREMNPWSGKRLVQRYGDRLLVIEPPPEPPTPAEMDRVYAFPFSNRPHPSYQGRIPAYETIRDSIQAIRGCPGGCAFCGLVAHQGRQIISRSAHSILNEVERLKRTPGFKGIISDVGGPAGNMWGCHSADLNLCRRCRRVSCLHPKICPNFVIEEKPLIDLFRRIRNTSGIRQVHISSGIRLGLAVRQRELMKDIIRYHVPGQIKVAPEHLHPHVLDLMRKDPPEDFYNFMKFFEEESKKAGKEQYLIPLFISNFPGCTAEEMKTVDEFLNRHHWSPQQVQDFIPLPMTTAAAMYYTGKTPDGTPLVVNRGLAERRPQLNVLKKKRIGSRALEPKPEFHHDDRSRNAQTAPRHGSRPEARPPDRDKHGNRDRFHRP